MPIVDDRSTSGRAATNAVSDVYAMGATPLFALAIVGMPVSQLPVGRSQDLAGGEAVCTGPAFRWRVATRSIRSSPSASSRSASSTRAT
jgi:selenophosphate synthase